MSNKGEYVQPWSRQKKLQRAYAYDEVPSIDELVNITQDIQIGKRNPELQTLQAQTLFVLYYLTACRVSEIVRTSTLRRSKTVKKSFIDEKGNKIVRYKLNKDGEVTIRKRKVPHDYLGIRKKDITFEEINGKPCLLIRTENRKNKNRTTKRQPIPIEFEKELVKFLIKYTRMLSEDSFLFAFGIERATQIINKTVGWNAHFIRHVRATHLVSIYDFNEQSLIKFLGWTDGRPAKHYMELRSSDIVRQFYKTHRG